MKKLEDYLWKVMKNFSTRLKFIQRYMLVQIKNKLSSYKLTNKNKKPRLKIHA